MSRKRSKAPKPPKEPKPIPAAQLVGAVAHHLLRLGFIQRHRSPTGSRYMRWPGQPFELRISDHQWSGHNVTRQAQVVRSVALRPVPAEEVPLLALDLAIRFMVQADERRGYFRACRTAAGG